MGASPLGIVLSFGDYNTKMHQWLQLDIVLYRGYKLSSQGLKNYWRIHLKEPLVDCGPWEIGLKCLASDVSDDLCHANA